MSLLSIRRHSSVNGYALCTCQNLVIQVIIMFNDVFYLLFFSCINWRLDLPHVCQAYLVLDLFVFNAGLTIMHTVSEIFYHLHQSFHCFIWLNLLSWLILEAFNSLWSIIINNSRFSPIAVVDKLQKYIILLVFYIVVDHNFLLDTP